MSRSRTSMIELKRMFLTQASSCDYLVALVSEYTPGGLKQATRGDTSFRCQTHLAATNANLRASPAAVSSSLGEFNYQNNNETQSAADRARLKSSAELCDLYYQTFGELHCSLSQKNCSHWSRINRSRWFVCAYASLNERETTPLLVSLLQFKRTEKLVCKPKNVQRDLEPLS